MRSQQEDANHEPDVELFPQEEPAGTFDVDLPRLQNCEKLISTFHKLPSLWVYCYRSPNGLREVGIASQ